MDVYLLLENEVIGGHIDIFDCWLSRRWKGENSNSEPPAIRALQYEAEVTNSPISNIFSISSNTAGGMGIFLQREFRDG